MILVPKKLEESVKMLNELGVSDGVSLVQPSRKLSKQEKLKKIYHYTSFKNFKSIMNTMQLCFASSQNVNDINELFRPCAGLDISIMKNALHEIRLYKQISFSLDFDSNTKGSMSPYMWGHYGVNGTGICLELDLEKLEIDNEIYHDFISYANYPFLLEIPHDLNDEIRINQYIISQRKKIFFTKTNHWKIENEYRMISKTKHHIDISNSINGIYLTLNLGRNKKYHVQKLGVESRKFNEIINIVGDRVGVYMLYYKPDHANVLHPNIIDARKLKTQLQGKNNRK